MGLIVDREQLCAACGVSDSAITAWEKKGMPTVRKGRGQGMKSLYDLDAVRAWCAETGYGHTTQALLARLSRTEPPAPPAPQPAVSPVQMSAQAALDPYDAEALRFYSALEIAFELLPTELGKEGVPPEAIDRVLERLYQVMTKELRLRHEPEDFIANEINLLRAAVEEERATPSWTE